MELKFLGCGDSYNYVLGNNAAYFVDDETLYFIDMGQSIFQKALHENLLKGIKHVVILITHCHLDHIGSLGEAVTYFSVFSKGIDCSIVYPNPEDIRYYLEKNYPLENINIIKDKEGKIGNVSYRSVEAKHINHSYAYFLTDKTGTVYYSGDNSALNEEALTMLKEGKLIAFYQDTAWKSSKFHYGFNHLLEDIDPSLRPKVFVMHLPDIELGKKAIKEGFSSATQR